MKKILGLTVLALSLSLSQAPLAIAGNTCWKEQEMKMQSMMNKLHLSAEQHTKIKAIMDSTKQKLQPVREKMHDVREKINAAFKANDIDAKKQEMFVNEEIEQIGKSLKIRMEERVEIHNVLTEAQRTKLMEMKEEAKAKHKNK